MISGRERSSDAPNRRGASTLRHDAARVGQESRFEFGGNWLAFVASVDEERIAIAENSLKGKLGCDTLEGVRFLDIGSGSGLFSLAARKLGAQVHSFDCDSHSVACTNELKERHFSDDANWTVEEGSILDEGYLNSLGQFDVVYAWGALHHTGAMWDAMKNVADLVAERGKLFIAIYNDQGSASHLWRAIKRTYNSLPRWARFLVLGLAFIRLWGPTFLRDLLHARPLHTWLRHKKERGMAPWRDVVDWVGGYPFEVARPEEIFEFFRRRGFVLVKLKTCGGGRGCNEFVFTKEAPR